MIHPQDGILLGNKKEWTIDICSNIDKSKKNYAKWKEPDTKDYTVWFHVYDILTKPKIQGQKWDH